MKIGCSFIIKSNIVIMKKINLNIKNNDDSFVYLLEYRNNPYNIDNEYKKERARDELPQSAARKNNYDNRAKIHTK